MMTPSNITFYLTNIKCKIMCTLPHYASASFYFWGTQKLPPRSLYTYIERRCSKQTPFTGHPECLLPVTQ